MKVWGSPVPLSDQWDGEGLGLFRPWLDGTLGWSDLFAPHNEHRIVLTRLADLALFAAGGNWNPWWQLLLNSALHAAIATALLCFCWSEIPGKVRSIWMVGLALLFVAPAGWQNALWGFQSHAFFCGLLSVCALGGLLLGQPLKPRWWVGWFAALLALFTGGSGVFAATTALLLGSLLVCASYFSNRKSLSITSVLPLLALLLLVALGSTLRVEVPLHEPLRAQSPAQFCAVLFRCLSWPWVDSNWLWLVLALPWLWFTTNVLRRKTPPDAMERFILGLGLLTALHAAAVAYSRAAGLPGFRPLSRYQDPLVLGVIANLLVLLRLAGQNRSGRIAAILWSGTLLAGLLTLTTTNLSLHLPFKRIRDTAGLAQIRSYLTTNDAAVFVPVLHMPPLHPNITVVQRVLDDPQLRRVLPREFFDEKVRPPWLIEYSPWLTLLSATALILAAIKCRHLGRT